MNNYYGILAESLVKKYSLQEKFSDTMPSWLKKDISNEYKNNQTSRLGTITQSGGGNLYTADQAQNTIGPNVYASYGMSQKDVNGSSFHIGSVPNENGSPQYRNYSIPKGTGWSEKNIDRSLANNLNELGINISKVQFSPEMNPPKSENGIAVNSPQYGRMFPVWHFPNGQIYIKGVNDNELLDLDYSKTYLASTGFSIEQLDKLPPSAFHAISFKSRSFKILNALCDHFCYMYPDTGIDSKDVNKVYQRVNDRKEAINDLSSGKQSIKDIKDTYGIEPDSWYKSRFDKSGNIIISTIERFKDELGKIKFPKKLAEFQSDLDEVTDLVNETYDKCVRSFSRIPLSEFSQLNIRDIQSEFSHMSSYLDRIQRYIKIFEDAGNENDSWTMENAESNIELAMEYIQTATKSINSAISNYVYSYLDI